MISQFIIIGLSLTGFVTYIDNQNIDIQWIESCYGIECTDPEPSYYTDDGISYWNYFTNI